MVLRKTASPCCGGAGGLGSCEEPSVVRAVGCINLMFGQATCLALCFRWDYRDGGDFVSGAEGLSLDRDN